MPESERPWDQEMPLLEHLRELRRRVLWALLAFVAGAVAAYLTYGWYLGYLVRPVLTDPEAHVYGRTIYEGFTMRLKVATYVGLILALPVAVYQVAAFILPALSRRERLILGSCLVAGLVLALAGGAFGYVYIVPLSVRVLSSAEFWPEPVKPWLAFGDNVLFVFQMTLAFSVVFQLPLLLLALMALGVVSRQTLWRHSRYAIVAIFVVAAVATPPDVVSQLAMAFPLILLYYLAMVVAWMLGLGNAADTPAPD